jgi:hypothetical protein
MLDLPSLAWFMPTSMRLRLVGDTLSRINLRLRRLR